MDFYGWVQIYLKVRTNNKQIKEKENENENKKETRKQKYFNCN